MGRDDEGWGRGQRPVINVSWDDAQAYVQWLSSKTGKPYRLLSEAEWEYACRAGTETAYSFGDIHLEGASAVSGGRPGQLGSTVEVGSFPANDFGLYDMHGNVWEWCEDRWHESYTDKPESLMQTGGAWTSGDGQMLRVLRGGFWFDTSAGPPRLRDRKQRDNRCSQSGSTISGFALQGQFLLLETLSLHLSRFSPWSKGLAPAFRRRR